jgi:hypothetical protein
MLLSPRISHADLQFDTVDAAGELAFRRGDYEGALDYLKLGEAVAFDNESREELLSITLNYLAVARRAPQTVKERTNIHPDVVYLMAVKFAAREEADSALSDLKDGGGCPTASVSPTLPVPTGTYNFTLNSSPSAAIQPTKGFGDSRPDAWVSFNVALPSTDSPINATIRMNVKPVSGSIPNDQDILACTPSSTPIYTSFAGLSTPHYTQLDIHIQDPAVLSAIQSGYLECYIGVEEAVQSVQLIVSPANGAS